MRTKRTWGNPGALGRRDRPNTFWRGSPVDGAGGSAVGEPAARRAGARYPRTRKTPNADIDAGYQHAVAVIMAMMAYDTGKRQIYDREKREVREG